MARVIRKNLWPFLAILVLVAIASVVGAYILREQRFQFPFIDPEPVTYKVELENAQAVTPGQGQTAQIAGVDNGRIGAVELVDGRAIVELEIEPEYDDVIHTNANALLRPRTGLKDMYVQIFPGGQNDEPLAEEGFTIPVSNTLTDVDLDEILAEFDTRTRDYLALLANGAGTGLRNRGNDLAEVFERFEPTFRDLARVNRSVAQEREALSSTITALAELNEELADNPDDLAELVDESATTFDAFAREDDNLRETVTELAPTLEQATTTLRAVQPFAQQLGPTTRALIPAFRSLDEANAAVQPFAREAAPIVRREIRPFVRAARPLVADLEPTAESLAETFPELRRDSKVLNTFFNMLAHNPLGREPAAKEGREEGYLFSFSWLAHQTVNLFNVDDANSPLRPVFLTGTCGTLASFVENEPQLEFLMNLSPVLATVCGNPETSSLDIEKALKVKGISASDAKDEGGPK